MPLWQEIGRALALVLIIESLVPFIAPRRYRRTMLTMAGLEDRVMRTIAGVVLVSGLLLLQLLRA